jgi:hypothetical protein
MEGLGPSQISFASFVVILAFSIRGTTGYGDRPATVSFLALVLAIQAVIAIVAMLTVICSLGHWIRDWRTPRVE